MRQTLRAAILAFAVLGAISACQREASHEAPPVDTARQDADFGVRLALLEGHLTVGRELLEAGQTENALPHFGHPVRELYSDMLPVIATRGGQQFDRDLVALEGLATQGRTPAFAPAYDAAMAKVRAARALIAADRLNSDAFTLQLIADVATAAAQEYRNAIVAGGVGSLVEYHDARGFVFYISDLLAAHRGDDARLMQVAALVAELKTYVEPLNPPDPIRATDAEFEAKAAAIRAVAAGPAPAGAP